MASSFLSALLISERFVSVLLLVFSPQNNAQNAGKVKWGFWHEAFVASGGPIFSLAREKIGEKRVLGDAGCMLPLILGGPQCFGLAFHSVVTLRMSWYAPPDTGVSNLILVALERLPSMEGTVKIWIICTFLRGAKIQGSPFRGAVCEAD